MLSSVGNGQRIDYQVSFNIDGHKMASGLKHALMGEEFAIVMLLFVYWRRNVVNMKEKPNGTTDE